MLKSALALSIVAVCVGVAGCASRAETVGTVAGTAAGAGIGSGPIGTPLGAAAGGVIGYEAGRYYDQHKK